jgi:hypothetical protein
VNDEEPENYQPPGWLVPLDQRTLEISIAEHCAEDLAESTEFCQVFERNKQMPHLSAMRSRWENMCAHLQYTKFAGDRLLSSELRRRLANDNNEVGMRLLDALKPLSRGRPKTDPDEDFQLLIAWLHCGIWMLSHEDRALFMQLLFPRETPISTEALRKRYKRHGLLGWHDFPQTYQQAPLSYFDRDKDKVLFKIAPRWKSFFSGLGVENNGSILIQVKLSIPLL